MQFHSRKFWALLLIGFLLFSIPQIINLFTVHDPITHQVESFPKLINDWQQSAIAFYSGSQISEYIS